MDTPNADSIANSRRSRKGHGRVTLQDIAERAAVTRITVSRYLREPGLVAPHTAARIHEAIQALGYVPNQQAGMLASGYSRIVVALVPNLGNTVFAETVQGISEGLLGTGLELMLMTSGYSQEKEAAQIRAALGWSPVALIVTGRQHGDEARALLEHAMRNGTTVVQLWDVVSAGSDESVATTRIGFNHAELGSAMFHSLMQSGHRNLAYVDTAVDTDFRAHERADGFVRAARAHGINVKTLRAAPGDFLEQGAECFRLLRLQLPVASAVAFANDALACGALMEASRCGVKVPGEVSLLGFGDLPLARVVTPSLSTVRPPSLDMGRAAALAIRDALHARPIPPQQTMDCAMVMRGSTSTR